MMNPACWTVVILSVPAPVLNSSALRAASAGSAAITIPASARALFLALGVIAFHLDCGPAQKQPLAIFERTVLADREIRPVLGLIALYDEFSPRRKGMFR